MPLPLGVETKDVALAVLGAVAAGVVGYAAAWLTGVGRLRTDLAFLKGQLTYLIRQGEKVDKVKEAHATLSREHAKTRKDVDAAHERLRETRAEVTALREKFQQ